MWKAKAYQVLPKVAQDYPKHRWLFLTVTLKNCPIGELRQTLDWMNKSFVRLTKLKEWPGVGWIKSVEVTRGKNGNAHPHLHVLLMVEPGYFGPNYLSQERWVDLKSLKCFKSTEGRYTYSLVIAVTPSVANGDRERCSLLIERLSRDTPYY